MNWKQLKGSGHSLGQMPNLPRRVVEGQEIFCQGITRQSKYLNPGTRKRSINATRSTAGYGELEDLVVVLSNQLS